MNIDLAATTQFGDTEGLKDFFLVHRFVHELTAAALTAKYHVAVGTFAVSSSNAEQAWVKLMQDKQGPTPPALQDWLSIHADMHNQAYALLGGPGTVAPDLSIADFSSAEQFNDWMSAHQSMHDYEYSQLGLS